MHAGRRTHRPRVEALEDRTVPATMLGLTTTSLLRFDSATPQVIATTPVLGLSQGELFISIDMRPSNGLIYGITSLQRLLTVNPTTGLTTLVGALTADPGDTTDPFKGIQSSFGLDFNPTDDALRLISASGENLRIDPDTARVTTEAFINPAGESILGVAFSNNVAGAVATTLFTIGTTNDKLFSVGNLANGTLTAIGALGVDTSTSAEMDITDDGKNFAVLNVAALSRLKTVNLSTGAATDVGTVGDGSQNVFGLTALHRNNPAFSANQKLANAMFQDVLGRPAGAAGATQFGNALDKGLSRADAARSIVGSQEARSNQIEALFQSLLGRATDAGGKAAFLAFMANGGTVEQVKGIIVASDEYFARKGGTNDAFLAAAFKDLLGRDIDPAGKKLFGDFLAKGGGTRYQVAWSVIRSDEARAGEVREAFRFFLKREIDAAGVNLFVAFLRSGGDSAALETALVGSTEYANRVN